jgi:hypothetical protein
VFFLFCIIVIVIITTTTTTTTTTITVHDTLILVNTELFSCIDSFPAL